MKLYELSALVPENNMCQVFCNTLLELAESNPDVVLFDADLMSCARTIPFLERYPERTFNCGIQEANAVGTACGMSIEGKIPFVHSFASFLSRRAYDQVFISGAYNRANVKLIGSDPGITAALTGGTHMPFEDMGIMRNIPGMICIEPTDNVMFADIIRQSAAKYGMFFIRLTRKEHTKIYKEGSHFEIGKATVLREGHDVTVICSGLCVKEAVLAADALANEGISVRVLNMFTWKPLDDIAVINASVETGAIVTAENHNVINGLGSAVAETLARTVPCPLELVGIEDEFGEVGPVNYLQDRFKLTEAEIIEKAKKVLERKNAVR